MRDAQRQMVREEEKKKANSHTSSSFCLGSPQGCNCFPSSHLCLFFFPPLFFLCFCSPPSSGNSLWENTHHARFLLVVISLSLISRFLALATVCVCAHCTPVSHALQVGVTSPPKGNGNWKWNMTACVSVHVSNMFLCRTNCTSFASHISCQGNIFPA